ncbi:MAG: 50S ribosomal protein L23 [Alphaproteobacteria bacterium]|nr:50S ribosomal protein L23 [Alphaproteobacteria bacterium]
MKPTQRSYDVILAPVVTEKALKNAGGQQVFFKVALNATKGQIKTAVQALFGAKVESVNTITTKGKSKSFGRRMGRRSDSKKAVVTLAKGQQIDLTKGIK